MIALVGFVVWVWLFGALATLVYRVTQTVDPGDVVTVVALLWPLFLTRTLWRGFKKAWRGSY